MPEHLIESGPQMKTIAADADTVNPNEHWESRFDPSLGAHRTRYTYRTVDGRVFETEAPCLATARARRDAWLRGQEIRPGSGLNGPRTPPTGPRYAK